MEGFMRDFDRFVNAYSYYINKKDYECFYEQIKDLKCNDFRFLYHLAFYQNKKKQYDTAQINIEKSIEALSVINYDPLSKEENSICLYTLEGYALDLPTIKEQISKVYFLAGEVYANRNISDKSIEYYKKHLYYKLFLKSDFEEAKSVSLLSFRNYNLYTLSDIINNEITVCPSRNMYDPFDSIINLWASDENLSNLCSTDAKHIQTYSKSFNCFRIRSFCLYKKKTLQNILMWSHYAGEHKGFCVKYQLSEHFIKRPETNEYKHIYLKKIDYRNVKIDLKSHSINTDLAFAKKDKCWKYEDEVRLISYDFDNNNEFQQIPLDKDSKIEAIYFGCNCSDKDKQTIYNIISKIYDYKILFYNMKKDFGDVYNLKIEKYKV